MWAKAKLFNELKHLFKHSLNPRSSLRYPDCWTTTEGWQTPVNCCQTYLRKAPSWLPVLTHTSGSPSGVTDTTDATHNHWNLLLTMNIYVFSYKTEVLCEGRDTYAGFICCQRLRHSGGEPCIGWQGMQTCTPGSGPRLRAQGTFSFCLNLIQEQCLCVLHHKIALSSSGSKLHMP